MRYNGIICVMSTSFLTVVEDVKQLSTDEKEELHALLEQYLIEERREAIFRAGENSRLRLANDELDFLSDPDELMQSLND
jgi:hypothetical protein